MSGLELFLKGNQKKRENAMYPATSTLRDAKGNPLLWEIRALTPKEVKRLRKDYTIEIPVTGKTGIFREKIDANAFAAAFACKSVVVPDLLNAQLQDSYGVKTPEELLEQMIPLPGEYDEFTAFVQKHSGYDVTLQDKVDEAKNS